MSTSAIGRVALALLALAVSTWAAAGTMPPGESKAKASNCFSCHAVDHKVVGPAFRAVAKRYAGKGNSVIDTLVNKIRKGGAGNWGQVPMSPHPNLSTADITAMVHWILSLKPKAGAGAEAGIATSKHTYTNSEGKKVNTDFAVFTPGTKHVTGAVFKGYEQYNSYCFRCHGGDAIGGEYAPDLRHSLSGGMTWQQFLSTAMVGRQAKGMPSWAGFFDEKQIRDIYEYVRARELKLVGPGRPPSAQD
jgi:cytochrome c